MSGSKDRTATAARAAIEGDPLLSANEKAKRLDALKPIPGIEIVIGGPILRITQPRGSKVEAQAAE